MDTPQELVLTSPGGLSRGSRYKTFSEPAATNRTLAEAFEKLGLVERVGNGTPANLIPTPSCGKRSRSSMRATECGLCFEFSTGPSMNGWPFSWRDGAGNRT